MTAGDDVPAEPSGRRADQTVAAARPLLVTNSDITPATGLILVPQPGSLPAAWAGPVPAGGLEPGEVATLLAAVRPCSLLPEHAAGWFGRPGLSGHRLGNGGGHPAAGRDWSPLLPAGPAGAWGAVGPRRGGGHHRRPAPGDQG